MTRLAAAAGILSISFSAIFMRLASASPATAAFFRAAYAIPLLLVVWSMVRSRDHRSGRSRLLAFGAGIVLAVDLTLWQMSIDRIGAGPAVVVANTQVVIVGLAAWLLYRERPTAVALATIPVVLAGVALISGLGREDAYGTDPVAGVLLGLATAVAYSTYMLVFRQSNRGYLAPSAGPLLDATAGTLIGSLLLGLLDPGFTLAFRWPEHGWFLGLGLLIQGVGWLFITHALPRLPALDTSAMLLLQPMLSVLWAQIIFDEPLSAVQWSSVALVLGGIVLMALTGTVRETGEVKPASAGARPGS
jgi:drug/metabolite transporter (DMT)-like permease